jgi:chromosome segregation ATPase
VSRRRDMTPTLERRDGQIETLMKSLAREQAKSRDLRNDLRDSRRETQTALEQLRIAQETIRKLETPHEAPPAPEPPRRWHQRWLSKIIPT